jgi:predicted FMN-binding regulatory protein PaiB
MRGRTPDPYYEEKVSRGLTVPTWDYMTAAEAHAVLNGRYRGDGRRIDQYVNDDPLGINEETI